MSQYTRPSDINQTVITQVSDNEFFVEAEGDARFGFEIDPSYLTFVDIDGGPTIHINRDFLGKGFVKQIDRIDDDKDNLIIKVTIDNDY